MSKTLSNGYKKPEDDDSGDSWFQDLEDNWQRANDHKHDGADSELLTPTTQTISSGNWDDDGNDTHSQTIDVTDANSAFTFDALGMEFRLSSGTIIYPTVEKVTSTTYKIFINDNTQTLTAIYT